MAKQKPTDEQIDEAAREVIYKVLTGEEEPSPKSTLAMQSRNNATKEKAMLQRDKSLGLAMVKTFVPKEELQKYKKASMPHVQKLLKS